MSRDYYYNYNIGIYLLTYHHLLDISISIDYDVQTRL